MPCFDNKVETYSIEMVFMNEEIDTIVEGKMLFKIQVKLQNDSEHNESSNSLSGFFRNHRSSSSTREPPRTLVFVSNAVCKVLHKQTWLVGTNSLVRIEMVKGDSDKRALSALIRPSSHQHRRQFDL
ncbi:Uncharacterized protein Fot_40702 [Forsythia ovata]|uniref:Uncharacterized protein n=1 Tax=Forsythia ovata TaxID=205694 RepID=A0ABD1S885_9LAMI